MLLATILQGVNIEEKIKNAPDSSYEVGVFIGSMLPFVVLVVIAYLIYRHHKNKIKNE
jgi:hypothetical protein